MNPQLKLNHFSLRRILTEPIFGGKGGVEECDEINQRNLYI